MVTYIFFIFIYAFVSGATMKIARYAGAKLAWLAWLPGLRELLVIKLAQKRLRWIFLTLIPVINFWACWIIWGNLAKRINRSAWWGRLMVVPFLNLFMLAVLGFKLNPKNWPGAIVTRIKSRRQRPETAGVGATNSPQPLN
jgi:hypothetical protein